MLDPERFLIRSGSLPSTYLHTPNLDLEVWWGKVLSRIPRLIFFDKFMLRTCSKSEPRTVLVSVETT